LWAANQSSGDVWISRFPFNHQTLRLLEIVVFHHDFGVRLRLGHEAELLHGRLIVNVGLDPRILKTPLKLTRFSRLIKRGNGHHKVSSMRGGSLL
jgi:hypothetical protein